MIRNKEFEIKNKKLFFKANWNVRETEGYHFDIDLLVFMLNKTDKVNKNSDFIFFNNLSSDCGSIIHHGDNRVGSKKDEEPEKIEINFEKIPKSVNKITFWGSIYKAKERNQNFGQIKNAEISFIDESNNEIFNFDLSEEASSYIGMNILEIVRSNDNKWILRTLEQGTKDDLYSIVKKYIVG